jgi:hypothetical protein
MTRKGQLYVKCPVERVEREVAPATEEVDVPAREAAAAAAAAAAAVAAAAADARTEETETDEGAVAAMVAAAVRRVISAAGE